MYATSQRRVLISLYLGLGSVPFNLNFIKVNVKVFKNTQHYIFWSYFKCFYFTGWNTGFFFRLEISVFMNIYVIILIKHWFDKCDTLLQFNSISRVIVRVFTSSAVDRGFKPHQVKPKTINVVFVAYRLSTQHQGVKRAEY
jgi:hypothetical protein